MSKRRSARRTRSGARHLARYLAHWAGGHTVSSEELLRRIVKDRAEAHQDAIEDHHRQINRALSRAAKLRRIAQEDGGLTPAAKAQLEAAESQAERGAAALAALGEFRVPTLDPDQVHHRRQRVAAARCTLLAVPVAGIGTATVAGGAWWAAPAAAALGVVSAWARGPEPLELTVRPVPADLIAATPAVVPPTGSPTLAGAPAGTRTVPPVAGAAPATVPGAPPTGPGAPGDAPGLGGPVPASVDLVTALSRGLAACRVIPRGTHVRVLEEDVLPERWAAVVRLPDDTGAIVDDVVAARKGLGGELGLDRSRLHVERVPGADDKTMLISGFAVDPFAQPVLCTAEMLADVDVWEQGIPVAVDAWGRLLYVRLRDVSLLLGGSSRSGKGAALRLIIAGCLLDSRVRLTLADGKHPGQHRWAGLTTCHIYDPEKRAKQLKVRLQELVEELGERAARLADEGIESLAERPDLVGTEGLELEVVVIDEVGVFTGDRKHGAKITKSLADLAARGLAFGIVLVLSTQLSSAAILPKEITGNITWRWCMYATGADESNGILGKGAAGRGYSAHLLDPQQRGIGLLLTEGRYSTVRSLWLDGDDMAEVQDMVRALRAPAPPTGAPAPAPAPTAPPMAAAAPVAGETTPVADWTVVEGWLTTPAAPSPEAADPKARALEVIRQAGPLGIKRAAVADAIGASPTTVGGWLKAWTDQGLVEVLGSPPHTRYAATDARQ
ncbi:FtsK/SpoIIIE domain-containing protein [Streptomyces sp. NBC_00237]|uniref:FtsK/SpoIIIE domain-containing protein n=1 Tax=Streptomyces sp. NBC_00237 TaxID=2975687 RepID=UPI0022551FD8|nr:FtsK/SpoIIIE domain-containing protein [Streptomyces sp. NBC_00237]MCX5207707.1 FtsK/SpoIIIE domain-containing protein [Streptomyces sp. NBC_00237]